MAPSKSSSQHPPRKRGRYSKGGSAPTHASTPQPPQGQRRNALQFWPHHLQRNIRLFTLTTLVLGILVGVILYAYNKLPPQMAIIGGAYATILTIITTAWEPIQSLIVKLWSETAQKGLTITASTVTVTVVVVLIIQPSHPQTSSFFQKPHILHKLQTLQEDIPVCHHDNGATWSFPYPGTITSCASSNLTMKAIPPASIAEVDLINVTTFFSAGSALRTEVYLSFQDINDAMTWAGICIRSPEDPKEKYFFLINSVGAWKIELQTIGGEFSILKEDDSLVHQITQPIKLTLLFQNGTLYGQIGENDIVAYGISDSSDLSSIPNLVGLAAERLGTRDPSILYSNFELNQIGDA